MARPGFIEARDALRAAERSLKSALAELAALQDSDRPQQLKDALIANHMVYLNRYRAELDAAKTAFAAFDRKKKGPKFVRRFPRNYLVNVSLTKELGDLLEEENGKGRPLSDIVRCALTEYLKPKASDAPDASNKPYVPF